MVRTRWRTGYGRKYGEVRNYVSNQHNATKDSIDANENRIYANRDEIRKKVVNASK